ncbi:MAG: hypothetical protein V3T88_01315, partial [Nitrosomonadaceae bacterium]
MPQINDLPFTVYTNLSVDRLLIDGVPIGPSLPPGGPNFSLQFNNGSGGFGGSSDAVWDDVLKELDINGSIISNDING